MANMEINHAVGYRGFCNLNASDSATAVTSAGTNYYLCTGGNIALTQDPIMGSGVWGAGYQVAGPISYAWNYFQLEGSVNFELTKYASNWNCLTYFAVDNRIKGGYVVLKPDGSNGYSGIGYCSSLSFDASEGSALTGTFNFKAEPSNNKFITNSTVSSSGTAGNDAYKNLRGAQLIAYWETAASCDSLSNTGFNQTNTGNIQDIINWSCSCNADLQLLKCCNYVSDLAKDASFSSNGPLAADYVLLGELSSEASLTVFKIAGQFARSNFHKELTNFTFKIGNVKSVDGKERKITIPKAIINNASTSMTTGASYVSAEFSYNGLGDGTKAVFEMNTI